MSQLGIHPAVGGVLISWGVIAIAGLLVWAWRWSGRLAESRMIFRAANKANINAKARWVIAEDRKAGASIDRSATLCDHRRLEYRRHYFKHRGDNNDQAHDYRLHCMDCHATKALAATRWEYVR